MTLLEWAMMIALSILWGGSYFFNGIAVHELPPFSVVALRVVIGAAILLMIVRLVGYKMPRDRRVWRFFTVSAILTNVAPFTMVVWSQTYVGSGLAAILNATTPLFAVVLAHYLTADEKMTVGRVAGVVIGFLGVAWMIGLDTFSGSHENLLPQIVVVLSSVFFALAPIYSRRFSGLRLPALVVSAGMSLMAAILIVPVAIVVDRPWTLPMPSNAVWGAAAGLGLLSTALGYLLYFRILATAGATDLILVTFLVPVSAIVLGALVLGERLAPQHYVGMAIIGIGLAAIDGRLFRRWR